MQTSPYFSQILFHDANSGTAKILEEKECGIFESDEQFSFVDIWVSQPASTEPNNGYDQCSWVNVGSKDCLESKLGLLQKICTPVDQVHYPQIHPPRYVGPRGLHLEKVSNSEKLSQILEISQSQSYICIIRQRHTLSRLHITRKLFETMMSTFSILPRFLEFVLLFGSKRGENEIGLPPMRFREFLPSKRGCAMHQRSPGFECAYALRYAELNGRQENQPWSVRQTAVYHRYRSERPTSTWVLISPSQSAETQLDRYLMTCGDVTTINPFEIHLIILDNALANWRPYIIEMAEKIRHQSNQVLVASIEAENPLVSLGVRERQELKDIEDRIIDTLLVIDSTSDTITCLCRKHAQYCRNFPSGSESVDDESNPISSALREKQQEVDVNRAKVAALQTKVNGTINLKRELPEVSGREKEARKENLTMRLLTEKGTKDAAAVKVLTIITLVYLPASAVSSFFSTQFVGRETDGYSTRLVVTSDAWKFAAISVPLTVGTIAVWWLWVQFQANRMKRSKWHWLLQKIQRVSWRPRRTASGSFGKENA